MITEISRNRCFGGVQSVYSHLSRELNCSMRFAIFVPPQAQSNKVPVLYWLSGLTCTEENFIVKAGVQRVAAELGLAIVAPDTSPRGLNIAGESDSYDLGLGAGFYVDATQEPWSRGYRMYSYISRELPGLVTDNFQIDSTRTGIFGHSMGGHGALTVALANQDVYKSVSAFAPISSLMCCPWGEKALTTFLGVDREQWSMYDATALVEKHGWHGPTILVDQGTEDQFLNNQLKPELLKVACDRAGVPLQLRFWSGYDHGYFFIATFIEDHLRHHAERLRC